MENPGMRSEKPTALPLLGISSCLLGNNVRYDGMLRRDDWILGTLSLHTRLVPLCPEVAIGMGVPRPPIRLLQHGDGLRAVGVSDSSLDVTAALRGYGEQMAEEHSDFCGYIFKARSPSCGLGSATIVQDDSGTPAGLGTGLFAAEWQRRQPEIPIVEEDGLANPPMRDAFLEQVFVLHRWCRAMAHGITAGRLLGFHAAHARLLRTRGVPGEARLARLARAASHKANEINSMGEAYLLALMSALRHPVSAAGHSRVLARAFTEIPRQPSRRARQEVSAALAAYRAGRLPRLVPLTLVRHYRRLASLPDTDDVYLNPGPQELALRFGI
jgi:uncharacterized protein YbbK (DUF523 family)/uncharacterized protein YbgA (DUF1722 family)